MFDYLMDRSTAADEWEQSNEETNGKDNPGKE